MVTFCQNVRIADIIGHFERILFVTNFYIEATNAGPTKLNEPPLDKKGHIRHRRMCPLDMIRFFYIDSQLIGFIHTHVTPVAAFEPDPKIHVCGSALAVLAVVDSRRSGFKVV